MNVLHNAVHILLVPIYGHDGWLHAMLAAVAAYFGFLRKEGTAAAA